jgi:hypothetical protein
VGRDVCAVRLSADERAAIEKAARRQRLTLSEFLRRAALVVAYRVGREVESRPKPPEPEPERASLFPPAAAVVNTYSSFEAYRSESPHAWSGSRLPPGGSMREG